MNRRSFLRLLGGAVAAPVVVPPVTYVFAPVGGWRSDVIVNPFTPGEATFRLKEWPVKAAEIEAIMPSIADLFFAETPLQKWLKFTQKEYPRVLSR